MKMRMGSLDPEKHMDRLKNPIDLNDKITIFQIKNCV